MKTRRLFAYAILFLMVLGATCETKIARED